MYICNVSNLNQNEMTNSDIYPELGQTTKATIEYRSSYGGSFYLTTSLDLKGRGIKQTGYGTNHKRELKTYHVTEKSMDKLKKEYDKLTIELNENGLSEEILDAHMENLKFTQNSAL